jgi:hypothetical protein
MQTSIPTKKQVKLLGLKTKASSQAENNFPSSHGLKPGDFCEGLNVFAFGIFLILSLLSIRFYRHNNYNIAFILVGLAFSFIIIYWINKNFVIKFYTIWMRCASWIGIVITTILIVFIFYLVFTPVGILLRLLRKDILNLNKNPNLKSYWIDKPQKKFNKEDYERQF